MTEQAQIIWTEADTEELRRIYSLSHAGRAARAIHDLAQKKGVPAAKIRWRARKLGFARALASHRPWTETEKDNLRHYVGRLPVYRIASILGRSVTSVKHEIRRLGMSRRVRERGYTRTELADMLGVDRGTLNSMLTRWPMKANLFGNFSQSEVQDWIWEHLEEMELRKMDQQWLKGLLKEAAA